MDDLAFEELVERVRERTDIVQIIGQRVPLDSHFKALCPFHSEKKPSFSVNPRGQYFHCFGCGVGGDVFKFLQLYEGRTFIDVLIELACELGIEVPFKVTEGNARIRELRTIEEVLTETAMFYHRSLTPEVKIYLRDERGFTEETISRFLIGYARGGLREYLIDKRKFELDLCLRAGVVKATEDGHIRDYFYNRVIFPNIKRGRVVHLSGRSLDGREPKYLHLPGEIRYLYNEDDLCNETVYIVEGITDCISAVQAGYPAVAILGSSNFKPEYLPRFSRCKSIYICLDGDRAGEEGARKIGGLIGERARIVRLPEGLDLNDYFKTHTGEEFKSLTASAMDVIEYELSLIPADTDKIALTRMLDPVLRQLARMEKVRAEAYLSYHIKPRFKLKKEDIDGYRELVNKYRRGEAEASSADVVSQDAEYAYAALFDGLVDLVEYNGEPAFLVKEGDELLLLSQVERNGVIYIPPPKEQIPWLLPRGEEVIGFYELRKFLPQTELDRALYDDLISYHRSISELPREEYYDLLVAWDLHTYLLENFQYSPIICLFAVPERGKSRTGKGMINFSYRGIHVESLRDAYLVRVSNDFQASLFFDVKDIWKKAEMSGTEDILLHRFEKRARVPRVLFPDRGAYRDIVYYTVFGPTVIATNEGVHRILETRAVSINMPETRRRFENDVTPELALPLKERLTAFRAAHMGESLSDVPKPAAGRLGDIMKPLLQIILLVRPEREVPFLGLVREFEAERLAEKADSLEARLLMTILGLREQVNGGRLPVKFITDMFNGDQPERNRITYQMVGRRLSAMGFKKTRMADGSSAIIWDEEKIERMRESYGLQKTSETSETSETSD